VETDLACLPALVPELVVHATEAGEQRLQWRGGPD